MGPWLIEVREPEELGPWLSGGPPERAGSVVMLVRGDTPTVRVFLPNALDAAKLEPQRVVVWLRDASLPSSPAVDQTFAADGEILAVTLKPDGSVGGWVTGDRIAVDDAAFAFEQAERIHG